MRSNSNLRWTALAVLGLVFAGCSEEPQSPLTMTDPALDVGTNAGWDLNDPLDGALDVNGAIWEWPVPFGVGTGQLNPFLSVQSNSVEEGFNSLVPSLDGKRYTNFTHDLSLNHVPMVEVEGVWYRELILDANEANSGMAARFAIQIFDLWMCDDAEAPQYDQVSDFQSNAECELIYGLGGETAYATDEVTSGSGLDLDYRILIPESMFGTAAEALAGDPVAGNVLLSTCYYQGAEAPSCGVYLVLHAKFGGENGWVTGSTFEEVSTIRHPVPGTLRLVKRIVNDHGGTAVVGDFGLATDAGALTFGPGVADGANTLAYTSNVIPVATGTYSLSEDDVAGYTEGSWSCTGAAGAVVDTYNAGSVAVESGEMVTCTITNDDDPGSLTLVKRIINDDGGTAVVGDFSLTTSAGTLTFGAGAADGASTLAYTSTTIPVSAGTYTFSEGDVSGYTEGSWSCSPTAATGTSYNSGSVAVANGVDVTCTITNDDDPGSLTLVKRIINNDGGTAVVGDFGITTSAGTLTFGAGVADGLSTLAYTSTALEVSAGTYTFGELDLPGYTEGSWSCSPTAATGTSYNSGSVAVANGVAVTCTITNDDIAPPAGDETAWAANNDDGIPGDLPYNEDGGNWATYVEYSGAKTTDLFAGQHQLAGQVTFSAAVDGWVTITITLSGWHFLVDGIDDVMVQDYSSAPSGNPSPGQFDHKFSATAPGSISFEVPEADFYGVHAVVIEN